MDVRLLETFRVVMDTQSVTRAAGILGVSQPAVSAQIARLESQVGFALFERTAGRLRPSPKGRRFFEEVGNVLNLMERLTDTAATIRNGETETVVVASHPAASIFLMPEVTAQLRRRRPGTVIRMINRTSEEVRALFEAGAADLAVAEWPVHLPNLVLNRFALRCVAVLPANHPLSGEKTITAKSLSGEPFVAMPRTRLIGHQIRAAFLEAKATFAPVIESEYFSTICGLVAAGCGVSVVDPMSARGFASAGIEVRSFEPEVHYEVTLFRRENAAIGDAAHEMFSLMEARLKEAAASGGATTTPRNQPREHL